MLSMFGKIYITVSHLSFLDSNQKISETVIWELRKDAAGGFEHIKEVTPYKKQLHSHLHPFVQTKRVKGTSGEVRTHPYATFSMRSLQVDKPVLADQQNLSLTSFVQTLDAA